MIAICVAVDTTNPPSEEWFIYHMSLGTISFILFYDRLTSQDGPLTQQPFISKLIVQRTKYEDESALQAYRRQCLDLKLYDKLVFCISTNDFLNPKENLNLSISKAGWKDGKIYPLISHIFPSNGQIAKGDADPTSRFLRFADDNQTSGDKAYLVCGNVSTTDLGEDARVAGETATVADTAVSGIIVNQYPDERDGHWQLTEARPLQYDASILRHYAKFRAMSHYFRS